MKTPESNAVWVENNTVQWTITSGIVQSHVGAAKITITECEKSSYDEFPLSSGNRGAFHYDFDKDKHYSVRLLLDGRECALSTL